MAYRVSGLGPRPGGGRRGTNFDDVKSGSSSTAPDRVITNSDEAPWHRPMPRWGGDGTTPPTPMPPPSRNGQTPYDSQGLHNLTMEAPPEAMSMFQPQVAPVAPPMPGVGMGGMTNFAPPAGLVAPASLIGGQPGIDPNDPTQALLKGLMGR